MIRKRHSIRFQMPLTISVITTIFLIITITILSYRAFRGVSKATFSGFSSTIEGYRSMMDSWLAENKTLVKTYAITPAVINYLLNSNSTNANIQLNETLQKFEAINNFSLNIGVTDTNGIILDNAKHTDIGKNIQDVRPGIWDNLKQSNYDIVYGTKIFKSSADNKWSLALISSVKDHNDRFIGTIYMLINWEEFINALKKIEIRGNRKTIRFR